MINNIKNLLIKAQIRPIKQLMAPKCWFWVSL